MEAITLDLKIAEEIKHYIKKNNIAVDTKLPSERKLAEHFKVNRTTLRFALQRLLNEGYLTTIEKKGYYIAREKIRKNIKVLRTYDSFTPNQKSHISIQLHSVQLMESDKILSQKMRQSIATRVYRILYIIKYHEETVAIQSNYIKQKTLLLMNLDLKNISDREIERAYVSQIHLSEEELYIERVKPFEQSFLHNKSDKDVIKQAGILYNQENEIVAYREIVMLPNQFTFEGW